MPKRQLVILEVIDTLTLEGRKLRLRCDGVDQIAEENFMLTGWERGQKLRLQNWMSLKGNGIN